MDKYIYLITLYDSSHDYIKLKEGYIETNSIIPKDVELHFNIYYKNKYRLGIKQINPASDTLKELLNFVVSLSEDINSTNMRLSRIQNKTHD